MIAAGDFRKGMTFEINNQPYVIIEFQHVKPGKGAAFVRTKYKNLMTGSIREDAFNPSEKFPKAHVERKEMQYLYSDTEFYYFMDNETYDQIPLTFDLVEDALKYLQENDNATLKFYKEKCFLVEPPTFVELKVAEAEPSVKGDTASNVTKKVIVETGAEFNVPLFINEGDVIKVDTRTGDYLSRV